MKKKAVWVVLILAALLLQSPHPSPADPEAKIRPALGLAMREAPDSAATLHVWVNFKDKGIADGTALRQALAVTRTGLRAHSLQRRAKSLPLDALVDEQDLPVSPDYALRARALSSGVRAVSRWLNAVSVEATPAQVQALAGLDCVASLDVVHGFKREEPLIIEREIGDLAAAGPDPIPGLKPFYGGAYRQVGMMGVPELHAAGLTGRGVIVCLLDIGFRKTHEAFRTARVIAEHDFVMKDGDVQRDPSNPLDYTDFHGTACWSLLGGYRPGTLVGPAFGADFILGKTEDDRSETPVEEDYWAAGIEWAESLGADVVSSSLGYTDWYRFADMNGRTAVTTKAANRATALGVVVVNAAGNERGGSWGHIIAPADGFDVIAVGAVDAKGKISTFSSPGPTADGRIKPEVCAMGVRNFTAMSGPNLGDASYSMGSGTSYATPLTAGVVALLLEAYPNWTVAQVRDALMSTAANAATPDNDYGWGLVNAPAAVRK
ncbi:MAG: S8 family serine peptidase [Candidatus Aminicenantes bacterium]|nr:S8 family serine peptidase [Candidatus Aminicenantes bacterium]